MHRRFLTLVVAVTLGLVTLAGPAFAEQETGALVVTKLFRGIANAATGWMEIPKQMSLTWQAQGPGVGLSWGFIKGIGWAIARSVGGAYEIVTFPFPIPEEYKPIMQPEYVLSDLPSGSPPSRVPKNR